MFSGPDQVQQTRAAGATLEWYQPVQEPGNVLSYPWSLSQLQAQYQNPPMNLLTSGTPTTFYTDSSSLVEQAQWQAGGSQSKTSGSGTNTSWGTSISVSQTPGITGGPIGNLTFSYNGSVSLSTLYTNTTSIGASTGLGITKPGTFPNPGEYQYAIQPFIFGTQPPTGTDQPISDFFDTSVPVQTSGVLQAAFTADPTNFNAGAWWQGAYPQPDLALNHPVRWSVTTVTASSPPPQCVRIAATALTVNCATFNEPQSDVWTSEFHWMKGLLITPANANGQGPQLGQATAGDQLLLQVRVYNYSLTDMPEGTRAVVRFYGQPWDVTRNTVAADAFLIDEVSLGPIPGFNSASNGGTQPNWALASTTRLDTASYSDQYLVFWSIVWIQDGQGRLVAEMPGHGLTSIPGVLTDIGQATPLLEPFSNNVGFYKYAFYIAPSNSSPAAGVPAALPRQASGQIKLPIAVESVSVSPRKALLNEQVQVSARLRAGAAPIDGLSVFFYDGRGNASDPVFDVETISHVRAGGEYEVRVPFRPATCGTHTLLVVAHPGQAANQTTLEVRLDGAAAAHELLVAVQGLDLSGPREAASPRVPARGRARVQASRPEGRSEQPRARSRVGAPQPERICPGGADPDRSDRELRQPSTPMRSGALSERDGRLDPETAREFHDETLPAVGARARSFLLDVRPPVDSRLRHDRRGVSRAGRFAARGHDRNRECLAPPRGSFSAWRVISASFGVDRPAATSGGTIPMAGP